MNIREALLEDVVHNKSIALRVAEYASSSPARFNALMQCFLSDEYRLAQRAAWSVCHAVQKRPRLVQPHIGRLVDQLQRNDVHPAVIRNSLRVLEITGIPEALHGNVLHTCFRLVEQPGTPAAIKAFSLTILCNLSRMYPDILPELKLIIQEQWHRETPAFKSRGKKILQGKC